MRFEIGDGHGHLTHFTLYRRSLFHHWRVHLSVMLGVAAGNAALIGALWVGDSMRGSLRELTLGRLGRVDHALMSTRFFPDAWASKLKFSTEFENGFDAFCPLILLAGSATHAESQALAHDIQVFGINEDFARLELEIDSPRSEGPGPPLGEAMLEGSNVVLNDALARQLGAKIGDDVLLRIGKPAAVPTESLLGRHDQTTTKLRVTVSSIVPTEGLGAFTLQARQARPRNAYVSLAALQRALDQGSKVNSILVTGGAKASDSGVRESDFLGRMLHGLVELEDLGIRLRRDETRHYLALESDGFLLAPGIERAAVQNAEELGLPAVRVLTYLANRIALAADAGEHRSIPYSTVSAVQTPPYPPLISGGWERTPLIRGGVETDAESPFQLLEPGSILLNQWAADDLGARVGDRVTLEYYVTGSFGRLETEQATFQVAGVVPLAGTVADPGFTPTYSGVTDAENLGDWDPPFPVDLKTVRPQDEEYWDRYRTTPKAFVSLTDGQRLWSTDDRFGRLTSIRFPRRPDQDLGSVAAAFRVKLLERLDFRALGFRFEAVRANALAAAEGSADFSLLFLGFSFFLVLSAAMLVALLFRLGVERRASEIGLLLAVGFTRGAAWRLLLAEGAALALLGGVLGIGGAAGYTGLMLAGLRNGWSAAVQAPFLSWHVSIDNLLIGLVAGLLIALISLSFAVRGVTRIAPSALLAGIVNAGPPVVSLGTLRSKSRGSESYLPPAPTGRGRNNKDPVTTGSVPIPMIRDRDSTRGYFPPSLRDDEPTLGAQGEGMLDQEGTKPRNAPFSRLGAAFCGAFSVFLMVLSTAEVISPTAGFFGAGGLMLAAGVALFLWFCKRRPGAPIHRRSETSLIRLGIRNASRNRNRSLLTVSLMASATFVIVALQALRLEAGADQDSKRSGTGGFALWGESSVPMLYDLNTPVGREAVNLSAETVDLLDSAAVVPFRLRPGDETGCTNLYRPKQPRVLGATTAMIERGGFDFSGTLAETEAERRNPWTLLERTFPDGAIPVIGDESAVQWQLKSGLGKDLTILDGNGREARLRFVALLRRSALQDELIVSEDRFKDLFPSINGYSFFLLDVPTDRIREVELGLERDLQDYGIDVSSTVERLNDYLAVQNTYLSTFQTLGGLGLLFGTLGLGAISLRHVWERRGELALMRALGFRRASLARLVFSENAFLVASGLGIGVVSALLAIAPQVAEHPRQVPWASLALMLAAVLIAGLGSGSLALVTTLRSPLLPALRRE